LQKLTLKRTQATAALSGEIKTQAKMIVNTQVVSISVATAASNITATAVVRLPRLHL